MKHFGLELKNQLSKWKIPCQLQPTLNLCFTVSSSAITFESFIVSLGANTLAALGKGTIPGQDISPDPLLAKEFIDVLVMLREKTKGNLTDKEAIVLNELIAKLEVEYIAFRAND